MSKRIPLKERTLPRYSVGEEVMNMITHIVGAILGVVVLVLCLLQAETTAARIGSGIFGCTMIGLYTVSSIYHGLPPSTGKKVMQVVDHCAIYFLISGTYTPILLGAFLPMYPAVCWGLLTLQWVLCFTAATLTAIDLKKYKVFSMFCYICMGWSIILFPGKCMQVMTPFGFWLLLAGGVVYTIGAILYGIGSKHKWFHSVFHIFVLGGSLLQFLSILLYAL